jgi:Domain of unknown function (DUF4438), N-terminal/Domain of unknown function (DUF4438), C-terminal
VTEPARINEDELLVTALVGEATSPSMGTNPYEVGADGVPAVPVGVGGICYNVRVGMSALGWAGDQVEPGVSIANPIAAANEALNVFACVGNRVVVRSGEAAGSEGVVAGKHEAFMASKHVLVHLGDPALGQVVPGDSFLVRAHGRGLRVEGLPQVACHSLGPDLWNAWAPEVRDGRLALSVTRVLAPEVVGMGSGRVSAITSVALQGEGAGKSLKDLRLGDIVAIRDWDASYYTGYREGALTVGVVASGDSPILGNGPGVTLLVSAPDGLIVPEVDVGANIAEMLRLE